MKSDFEKLVIARQYIKLLLKKDALRLGEIAELKHEIRKLKKKADVTEAEAKLIARNIKREEMYKNQAGALKKKNKTIKALRETRDKLISELNKLRNERTEANS